MTAHTTHIPSHTKWGRMVETVLRPARKAKKLLVRQKVTAVSLEELTPEMLVDDSPPTVQLTDEQAEGLSRLAHGTGSH